MYFGYLFSTIMVVQIFSPIQQFINYFVSLSKSFLIDTVLSVCFPFVPSVLESLKNNFLKQSCRLCNIVIAGIMFMTPSQLYFTFMHGIIKKYSFSLVCVTIHSHLVKPFSRLYIFDTFVKNQLIINEWVYFQGFLSYQSIFLFL